MSRKREKCRGVSHLFGRTDSLLKDLKSKNLCSFAQPRVSEELSDWQNVFAIPTFRFFEVLCHISYYYWAKATRSLYRGLRYIEVRYIDVLLYTCQPHLHPIYIISNTWTFSLRGVSILVHLRVGEGVAGGGGGAG